MPKDIEPIDPETKGLVAHGEDMVMTKRGKITRRAMLFIDRYFEVEMDAPKAFVLAGFAGKDPVAGAKKVLAHPVVSQIILERVKKMQERTEIDLAMIQEGLLNEATRENEAGGNPNARVSAWGNLARINGAFEKGQKKRIPVAINIDLGEDEEDDGLENEGEG